MSMVPDPKSKRRAEYRYGFSGLASLGGGCAQARWTPVEEPSRQRLKTLGGGSDSCGHVPIASCDEADETDLARRSVVDPRP